MVKDAIAYGGSGDIDSESQRKSGDTDSDFTSEDEDLDNPFELAVDNEGDNDDFVEEGLNNPIGLLVDRNANDFPSGNGMHNNGTSSLESIENQESDSIMEFTSESKHEFPLDQNGKLNDEISIDNNLPLKDLQRIKVAVKSYPLESKVVTSSKNISYSRSNENSSIGSAILKDDFATSKNDSAKMVKPARKKMRCEMPPNSVTSIDEMNRIS